MDTRLPPTARYSRSVPRTFSRPIGSCFPGYNVRPTEIAGAIGLQQLRKLDSFVERRRQNLALFNSLFAGDARFIIQRENGKSSTFCFPIILNPAFHLNRERVLECFERSRYRSSDHHRRQLSAA